ncbi:MAG: Vitamin K epoxide reductase [Actinobacteria bacterium]|uniref:Unannotated protein n=1 Tax=freshwater metagenome TaxID=449393 RepID=A0A6J7IYE1_9ZZZZ|nr:Vitamin K epoxide reductase [Actinomycetota bacterium]
MQSTQGSTRPRLDRSTAMILIFGGALGLLAAIELTIEKVRVLSDSTYVPTCDINPVLSCGSVITTPQAEAFGFPNPILGLIGFSVTITLGVIIATGTTLPRWMWLGLNAGALLGFAFVQWLVWQSLYSIGALCPWCMVVWAVTAPIAIWVTAANLASGRIPAPDSWQTSLEAIAGLRVFVLAGWYLTVLGLIFLRWQDFWTNSI